MVSAADQIAAARPATKGGNRDLRTRKKSASSALHTSILQAFEAVVAMVPLRSSPPVGALAAGIFLDLRQISKHPRCSHRCPLESCRGERSYFLVGSLAATAQKFVLRNLLRVTVGRIIADPVLQRVVGVHLSRRSGAMGPSLSHHQRPTRGHEGCLCPCRPAPQIGVEASGAAPSFINRLH